MSEEVKQEEVVETNPLLVVLDRMINEADGVENYDSGSAMEANVGDSVEHMMEFCQSVVGTVVSGDGESPIPMITEEDLALLVAIGVETGSRLQKDREQ